MREKSRVRVLLSWIHDILLFEGIYMLASSVRNAGMQEIKFLLFQGLFMLVPVILSYIVIRRCRNLWIFLVFSLAVTWGMYSVSKSVLTGGLTAFVLLFRCHVRLKQGEIRRKMKELPNEAGAQEDQAVWEVPTLLDSPGPGHCLIFVLLYLGVVYFHGYSLLNLMLGILAAELCVCLAYCYLERLEGFISDNVRVANLPAGVMKKIGTGILLFGVTGLILFMLPAVIYHKEPLTTLHFEVKNPGSGSIEFYEKDSDPDYMMEGLTALKAQAKVIPEWLEKVFQAMFVLTEFGIVCLAVKMIIMAVRRAMESFSDGGDDEIIFLGEEAAYKKEKNDLVRRKERGSFRSPDRKIRRLYKRLIMRNLKEKPDENETPLELESRAGLYEKEKEKTDSIHELYEKARYGKEECTKEELRRYVDALSGLK